MKNVFPKSLTDIFKDEYVGFNRGELVDIGSKLDFSLNENNCFTIESSTRQQSESGFLYKSGRITASRAKEICLVRSNNSDISFLKSICYPLANKFQYIIIYCNVMIAHQPMVFIVCWTTS